MAVEVFKLQSWEGSDLSRISHRISGRVRRDYYQVDGLGDCDDIDAAFAAGLPVPGTSPFLDDTIVRDTSRIAVFQSVAPFSCIYSVDSSANYSTTQYRRNTRIAQADPVELVIRNWKRHSVSGSQQGPEAWITAQGTPLLFKRIRYIRVDTKVGTNVTPERVIAYDSVNCGRWTTFGGGVGVTPTLYRYLGTDGVFDANGFSVLRATYETTARVKAIPAGTQTGWDVALPELPNLAEYTVGYVGQVPVVGVLHIQDVADEMEEYPW